MTNAKSTIAKGAVIAVSLGLLALSGAPASAAISNGLNLTAQVSSGNTAADLVQTAQRRAPRANPAGRAQNAGRGNSRFRTNCRLVKKHGYNRDGQPAIKYVKVCN